MPKHKGAVKQTEVSTLPDEVLVAKLEREKRLIMYSGVSFFMLLFAALWFVSFSGAVNGNGASSQGTASVEAVLAKLKADLDRTRTGLAATQAGSTTSQVSPSQELKMDELNIAITDANIQKLKTGIEAQITATSSGSLPINK